MHDVGEVVVVVVVVFVVVVVIGLEGGELPPDGVKVVVILSCGGAHVEK